MFHISTANHEALVQVNPWLALGAGIARQAVKDFCDPDPIKALDAFCWLLCDGSHWMGAMGVFMSDDQLFEKVVSI